MRKISFFVYLAFLIIISSCSSKNDTVILFASGYTPSGGSGFYSFEFDICKGDLKMISTSDAGMNPSYFCISTEKNLIYSLNAVKEFNGISGGGLTTLKYDSESNISEKINEMIIPGGGPCYISLSPDNDFLFMANYVGGSVVVIKLDDNGVPANITDTIVYKSEGENSSHAHMIAFNPSGDRVYVTDLGLDRIMIYSFDYETGKLNQLENGVVRLKEGSGPRHFTFNFEGTIMYVINEINSTISVFDVNKEGELNPIQTVSTLEDDFKGESYCADIHISTDGKFLYGSNRGENSIVTFRISDNGTLSKVESVNCGGNWPRNFVIDPSGKYLLVGNRRSDNISIFKLDKRTGLPIKQPKSFEIDEPACLKFFN